MGRPWPWCPTSRNVTEYSYFLEKRNSKSEVIGKIVEDVKKTWANINPYLPIMSDKAIYFKIKRLLADVKCVTLGTTFAQQKA